MCIGLAQSFTAATWLIVLFLVFASQIFFSEDDSGTWDAPQLENVYKKMPKNYVGHVSEKESSITKIENMLSIADWANRNKPWFYDLRLCRNKIYISI